MKKKMNERIIGAYKYKHFGNKGKIEEILQVLKEYRKTAKYIAKIQWNISKRSSLGEITPYTSKKQVLQILVKQYLERYKGCNSAPCELLMNNPYYRDYLGNSEHKMCMG